MRKIQLVAFTDSQSGELGLGIKGYTTVHPEMSAANEGLLIAHDILEHPNGFSFIGTVDDELEALGGIWYVRGQHGELNRKGMGSAYTIHQNIAYDIVRMYRDVIAGGVTSYYRDQASQLSHPVTADEDLKEICNEAEARYPGEFDGSEEDAAGVYYSTKARQQWPAFKRWALIRMRVGYRKTRRRWEGRGASPFAANNQFWAIADAVERYAKNPEHEGMVYVLRYGNGEATCNPEYDEDGQYND